MSLPFDARFAAWIAVALVLIVTPGPDTALIIRNALRAGARAASLSALGIGAGSSAWAAASVLGVAVLLQTSDLAFTLFRFAGAAYLVYLGLRSLAGTFHLPGDPSVEAAPTRLVLSRAQSSRLGTRVRKGLERVTGTVMIGLGVRLAFERR